MKIIEALREAVLQEDVDVQIRAFTGLIDGLQSHKSVRLDGSQRDVQRVIAMAAALVADHAHSLTITTDVCWEEAQLDLLTDLQDLIVHGIVSTGPITTIVLTNVPYTE